MCQHMNMTIHQAYHKRSIDQKGYKHVKTTRYLPSMTCICCHQLYRFLSFSPISVWITNLKRDNLGGITPPPHPTPTHRKINKRENTKKWCQEHLMNPRVLSGYQNKFIRLITMCHYWWVYLQINSLNPISQHWWISGTVLQEGYL